MATNYESRRKRKGYTLMEMLVVIAIIAILTAIAIPSVAAVRNALEFRRLNDYAKEIFLAAQSNLTSRVSDGTLREIQTLTEEEGLHSVPASNNALFPARDWSSEYRYTTSTRTDDVTAFDLVLPKTSIEQTLRDHKILIEYNPYTGNVFSVFYSEQDTQQMTYDNLTRDKAERKAIKLGYYQGSGLSGSSADRLVGDPTLKLVHDQEAFIELTVPVPSRTASPDDMMDAATFMSRLSARITVRGEMERPGVDAKNHSFFFDIDGSAFSTIPEANAVVCRYPIDSLSDGKSFAGLGLNDPDGSTNRGVGEITDPDDFVILPGENITVEAELHYTPTAGEIPINYDMLNIGGVNPMFESMEKKLEDGTSDGYYDLYITNGRQLQNLNAIHPDVAEQVGNVYISKDIDWQETVEYYNTVNHNTNYYNNVEEMPGRGLPNFVPISNDHLFGDPTDVSTSLDGTLTAKDETNAVFNGGGFIIRNLTIDGGTAYNAGNTCLGKNYYAAGTSFAGKNFTGLFSYVNTSVKDLFITNPRVSGVADSSAATGVMAGAAGADSFFSNCGVYVEVDGLTVEARQALVNECTVTGSGAVGGFVGSAKALSRIGNGIYVPADVTEEQVTFARCFAAVYVSGTVNRGIGGFIGQSLNANALDCYASGTVTPRNTLSKTLGAGGFVGQSYGTRYYNCFATGNIGGANAVDPNQAKPGKPKKNDKNDTTTTLPESVYGSGGFVGVVDLTAGGQRSYFSSCYSAGLLDYGDVGYKDNSESNGRFSGYLNNNSGTAIADANFDYYNNKTQSIQKDSYYLNMIKASVASDKCAVVAEYGSLADLRVFQLGLAQDNKNAEYSTGFSIVWGPAAETTTHRYNSTGGTFPFSKLIHHDYYGDWVYYTPGVGIAYYERYEDNTESLAFTTGDKYENKKVVFCNTKNDRVVQDGYALLLNWGSDFNGWTSQTVTIIINDEKDPNKYLNAGHKGDDRYFDYINGNQVKVNDVAYHMAYFKPALLDYIIENYEPEYGGNFYYKVELQVPVKSGGNDTTGGGKKDKILRAWVYLNPQFAMSQVNPIIKDTSLIYQPAQPTEAPSEIHIRSPRHLYELGDYTRGGGRDYRYWGKEFNFVQDLDIWPGDYKWDEWPYIGKVPKFMPIGTKDHPFQGSYTGGQLLDHAPILGEVPRTTDNNNYGLFGVIGADGRVSNLQLADTAKVTLPSGTVNAGMLAAVNMGKISNISQTGTYSGVTKGNGTVHSTVTMNPGYNLEISGKATNIGLLVGENRGSITGCTLEAGTVKVTDAGNGNVGGLVGLQNGIYDSGKNAGSMITKCNVTVDTLEASANYVGGIIGASGMASDPQDGNNELHLAENTFDVQNVKGTKTVGGLIGYLGSARAQNITFTGHNVQSSTGVAAGFAGKLDGVALRNLNITTSGNVTGATGASGAFGTGTNVQTDNANAVGAAYSTVDITLAGTVSAASGDAAGAFLGTTLVGNGLESTHVYAVPSAAITGKNAAGFATSISVSADVAEDAKDACKVWSCSVNGTAAVTGTESAAGFANTISCNVERSGVSTANKNTAAEFLKASIGNIRISAPTAAGFAGTVEADKTLTNVYALGTVGNPEGGETAAGLVNTNNGTINGSMTNVQIGEGAGFVGTNSGTVKNSYAWYTTGEWTARANPVSSFVTVNNGTVSGSYAAKLGAGEAAFAASAGSNAVFENCYNVTANKGDDEKIGEVVTAQRLSYELMSEITPNDLNDVNVWGLSDSGNKYPYSANLKEYPYPMVQNLAQMGDWIGAKDFSYGIVYYETYLNNGSYATSWDIKDYFDPSAEGKSFNTLDKEDALKPLQVADYGYAILAHKTSQITSVVKDGTPVNIEELTTKDSLIPSGNVNYSDYHFYLLSENQDKQGIYTVTFDDKTVTVNTCFADAMDYKDTDTLRIRAGRQLQNAANTAFAGRNFVIEKDIAYTLGADTYLAPLAEFSGSLNGNGHTIAGVHTASGLFGIVKANSTITKLNITGANVASTAHQKDLGILADTLEKGAVISECKVENSVLTADAENVGALVGYVSQGTVQKSQVIKNTIHATGSGSIGGAIGQSVGAKASDILASGNTITVKGAAKDAYETVDASKEAVYNVGGLIGWADGKTAGELGTVSNCTVQRLDLNESSHVDSQINVNVEQATNVPGVLNVGGIVGNNEAKVSGAVVTDLHITTTGADAVADKADGTAPVYPKLTANIGGLVGAMNPESTLTESHVGKTDKTAGAEITANAGTNTNVTRYIGGAVGSDAAGAADGKEASYSKVYAVNTITADSGSKGQFIGNIVNGKFNSCEGWGNAADFYGSITHEDSPVTESGVEYYAVGADNQTFTKVTGTLNAATYKAALTKCFYQNTEGKAVLKYVGAENYLYTRTETAVTGFTTAEAGAATENLMLAVSEGGALKLLGVDNGKLIVYSVTPSAGGTFNLYGTEPASVLWSKAADGTFSLGGIAARMEADGTVTATIAGDSYSVAVGSSTVFSAYSATGTEGAKAELYTDSGKRDSKLTGYVTAVTVPGTFADVTVPERTVPAKYPEAGLPKTASADAVTAQMTFTITWKVEDQQDRVDHVAKNSMPAYGDDPTKDGYDFTGWDKEVVAATENVTYTAQFTVKTQTTAEEG